jgi:hypothetical protein
MNIDGLFVEAYRPLQNTYNGTLKGWLTVRIPKSGIDIRGISYHENDTGMRWIEMPYRLRRKPDGDLKIYSIRFINAEDWRIFREATIEALSMYRRDPA